MEVEDGGPAFSGFSETYNNQGFTAPTGYFAGMSLRDYFAGQALIGYAGAPGIHLIACDAYKLADAMIKARENKDREQV